MDRDYLRSELVSKSFNSVASYTMKIRELNGEPIAAVSHERILGDAIGRHFKNLAVFSDGSVSDFQRRNPKLSEVRLQAQHSGYRDDKDDDMELADMGDDTGEGEGAEEAPSGGAAEAAAERKATGAAATTSASGAAARQKGGGAAPPTVSPAKMLKKLQLGVHAATGAVPYDKAKLMGVSVLTADEEREIDEVYDGGINLSAKPTKSFLELKEGGGADGMLNRLRSSRFYDADDGGGGGGGMPTGKVAKSHSSQIIISTGRQANTDSRQVKSAVPAPLRAAASESPRPRQSAIPGVAGDTGGRRDAYGTATNKSVSPGAGAGAGAGIFQRIKNVFSKI